MSFFTIPAFVYTWHTVKNVLLSYYFIPSLDIAGLDLMNWYNHSESLAQKYSFCDVWIHFDLPGVSMNLAISR